MNTKNSMDRQPERSRADHAGFQPAVHRIRELPAVCGGFWGSAIFAVWLYRRLTGAVTIRQAVNIGLLTGLLAGLLGFDWVSLAWPGRRAS